MYTHDWGKNWQISKDGIHLSKKITPVFELYLSDLADSGVSKKTFNRQKNACYALGSYIIGEVYGYENDTFSETQTGVDILLHYIDQFEGPLVYHDNELWQKELDSVCRKLFKTIQHY
ncbi:MAG: hypothetical protein GXP08_13815 [Gammaproteobacteria bacterium]|nr:hypothetical protein [Gammaproteobacteria bacterium]